jgi:hypothetical protein
LPQGRQDPTDDFPLVIVEPLRGDEDYLYPEVVEPDAFFSAYPAIWLIADG